MPRASGLAIVVVVAAAGTAHAQAPGDRVHLGSALSGSATDPDEQNPRPDEPAASNNPWFVRVGYSPAHLLAESPLLSRERAARALTFEVGRQTDGSRDWHRVYNYPSYGVGFYLGRFDNEQELGHPFAAYGFFSWPFPISQRAHVTADFGWGVSWNWTEFDSTTNPANTTLGSDVAYHVDGGVYLRYIANTRANVYAGLDVTHWSNGATKQPNLGLAVVGPKVGVRYNLAPQVLRSRPRTEELPRFEPSWEFVVGAAGSGKNVTAATNAQIAAVDRRRSFVAFNITSGIQRQFYRYGKVAGGTDVTYDGATGARVDLFNRRLVESRALTGQRYALGLYGGYEHVIARVSVLLQLGYAVWRGFEDEDVPRFYQRYGSRFHLTDRVWATFAVRSIRVRKANFMEFGLGYRLRWH